MSGTFSVSQLRFALARQLGQEMTPHAAATVLSIAVANPLPVPVLPEGAHGLDTSLDPRYFEFLNTVLEASYDPLCSRVIASVSEDGRIRAVIAYANPGRYGIEMAVASDGNGTWMTRAYLRAMFAYPFQQLGLRRAETRTKSSNLHALQFIEKLGFRPEGVRRQAFGEDDAVLMGMLRRECRWIKEST
ncbi:MAG: N-acetyltransferase [Rubrivivax sp.]|nr:MAG: N-acetyltransferase [Rubrivivax sp.]